MAAHRDHHTDDMFEVPRALKPLPGGLAIGPAPRGLLGDLLKESTMSRYEVAARMSELTGHEISKHMLDSWTADSRAGWRFPLEWLPAFEAALETHRVTAWLADLRGGHLLVGKEALDAEIGRLERRRDQDNQRIRRLKKVLGVNHE